MKKILLLSILLTNYLVFASTETIDCPSNSGCAECFKLTEMPYTCNASQNSCSKDMVTGLNDVAVNASGGGKFIRQQTPGTIDLIPLQNQISWTKQDMAANMFELTNPGFFTAASAVGQKGYQLAESGFYGHYLPVGTSVIWTAMKTNAWLRPDLASPGASRNNPAYQVNFTPRFYTDSTNYIDHKQCMYIYVRFCGDNVIDTDKSEVCDNGAANGTAGNTCSATCQTVTSTLSCTNLTLSPAQLTKNGGSLTATCTASVASGTQYKLVLKQGATTLETIEYQSSATKTFAYTLPANGSTTDKTYSVECYVKNGTQTDKTSSTCNKNITVPGTPLEPAVCNSLTVAPTSAYVNTPIAYSCSATNATSYVIKSGSVVLGSTPEGTFNFPTAGTYIIGCFINGQTNGPAECAKTVTITNPPVSTIPNIFIDKDDSTPGTPDSDGNDTQRVQTNGTATFTIRVLNNGNEALKTVVIDDSLASDCARTASQTASLYAGGTTTHFDIGESFTYTCSKNNVTNSTFPNSRNTASVKGVGVTSGTNVTDSDVTEIFLKQGNPSIKVEKDDDDNSDDEQEIDEDDTATFTVEVTNDGDEALENVELADDLSPDCDRDESETRDMIRDIGNHDSLFDPDESFTYTCKERSVTIDTFPDEENTVCVEANGVDTDEDVDDCDNTKIIVIENEDDTEEDFVCENIESSEGTFGGAPFRTIITCDAQEDDTCEIEVVRDGEIINTYDSCSKSITFSETGDYSVACIVNDDRSSDCEMEITVEAMTDIPTGTKILILAFLSLILSAIGMHFYKKKTI